MSRHRRLFPLLLLAGLGCSPEGPSDFYRETLQARSEFADTLTFIVDEPTAVRHFPPALTILTRRADGIRDAFEAWNKKTEVTPGFDRLARETFKLSDIGKERKLDMEYALHAYEDFARNIIFVNARLSREMKRLQLIYQASLAKKIEGDGKLNGTDFPGLSKAIEQIWQLRTTAPPRLFNPMLTPNDFKKLFKPEQFDYDLITSFDPGDIFAPNPRVQTPPPPETPANVSNAIDKMADRIAKIPNQLTTGVEAQYEDFTPRRQSLKNVTGKTLRNVSGVLVVHSDGGKTERWVPVNFPEWKLEPIQMPVAATDRPTKMRLMFEAEVEGGGQVGYDQLLPPIPKSTRGQ